MKLTLDTLIARAAPYATRSQLRRGDQSAFRSAKQQGLLDTLYPNPLSTPAPLTESIVRERAAQCQSRNEFKQKHDAAWRHAHKLGIMDMLFPPKELKQRMPKQPRPEKPELIGPVKTKRQYRKLTADDCRTLAKNYHSLNQMQGEDMGLYLKIRKLGLREELFPERKSSGTKNNCFYMARADGLWYMGSPVYKVGATSEHLRNSRIGNHARHARNTLVEVIPPTQICGKATDIEKFALTLGQDPGRSGFDGCTEYRAYTPEDVQAIKDMVELCRV